MSEFDSGDSLAPVPYVVHGSFRKHLDNIQAVVTALDGTGYAMAIAPHDCIASDERDGFVLLPGEQSKDPRQIEAEYLQKVLSLKTLGGFSLWVVPDGYVGKSAAYEYGIAQACGVPAYFTEAPKDVPFYVSPHAIKRADQLAQELLCGDKVTQLCEDGDELGQMWSRLPFPTASVAVGGIVRYGGRMLLVRDGRWLDDELTVPGTTVRTNETRNGALARALDSKFGMNVRDVLPLCTSFMMDDSGYGKPVSSLVFDDHLVDLASERVQSQPGLHTFWVKSDEVTALIQTGHLEPNAAKLITAYLSAA
jgi:ADP-ribose pyrophosphatase YjhB (NUDIX family)